MEDDKFLELLASMMASLAEMSGNIRKDSISTSAGDYAIETGPLPFPPPDHPDLNWVTVIGVTNKNGSFGPCGVEAYPTKEAADAGHDSWRRTIMDTPLLLLKDTLTGEMTVVQV